MVATLLLYLLITALTLCFLVLGGIGTGTYK
jgi:hypothetical protein